LDITGQSSPPAHNLEALRRKNEPVVLPDSVVSRVAEVIASHANTIGIDDTDPRFLQLVIFAEDVTQATINALKDLSNAKTNPVHH